MDEKSPGKVFNVCCFQHQALGKIEKTSKTTKESPAQRAEPEKTEKNKQSDGMTRRRAEESMRLLDGKQINNKETADKTHR